MVLEGVEIGTEGAPSSRGTVVPVEAGKHQHSAAKLYNDVTNALK